MARIMKCIAAASTIAAILFATVYQRLHLDILCTLAITAGTIAYHFDIRLLVGAAVNAAMHNRADYRRLHYRPFPFEEKLYRKMKVGKWKDRLPTYNPELFSMQQPLEDVIQAMCQAEIVHEIIFLLSFLPILTSIWFGTFPVFLLTSIFAAGVDLLFIIAQRYNRPRLIRLQQRIQNRK